MSLIDESLFSLCELLVCLCVHLLPFECTILCQPPGGSSNLWDLVSVINGQDDSLLPASYSKGVMHMKHLLKFKTVRSSDSPVKWKAHPVCGKPARPHCEAFQGFKPACFYTACPATAHVIGLTLIHTLTIHVIYRFLSY